MINGTAPPREIELEASILETGIAGMAIGFAVYLGLTFIWALGLFIDWLLPRVPGLGWVSFAALLGCGFLGGVWHATVSRRD